jgi:threonine/homoserine/homoserine lactone efflux protein
MTFVIGFLFGFIGSIPIAGPIALLVFAYGVGDRTKQALFIALGGAIAEGAYAYMAFWGLTRLLDAYSYVIPYSRGVGSLVLLALGIVFTFRTPKRHDFDEQQRRAGTKRALFLGLTITALNPTLLVTWTAAATTLLSSGLISPSALRNPIFFALGAMSGIVTWFATLLGLLQRYKSRFREETLARVVRGIGVALLGLSAWFGFRFVAYLVTGRALSISASRNRRPPRARAR